jgi:hypothetical protein
LLWLTRMLRCRWDYLESWRVRGEGLAFDPDGGMSLIRCISPGYRVSIRGAFVNSASEFNVGSQHVNLWKFQGLVCCSASIPKRMAGVEDITILIAEENFGWLVGLTACGRP